MRLSLPDREALEANRAPVKRGLQPVRQSAVRPDFGAFDILIAVDDAGESMVLPRFGNDLLGHCLRRTGSLLGMGQTWGGASVSSACNRRLSNSAAHDYPDFSENLLTKFCEIRVDTNHPFAYRARGDDQHARPEPMVPLGRRRINRRSNVSNVQEKCALRFCWLVPSSP